MNESMKDVWAVLSTPEPQPKSLFIQNNPKYYLIWHKLNTTQERYNENNK